MSVFCKHIRKFLSDEGCVMRIKQTVNAKTLKKCRNCIMANPDRADIIEAKLGVIDAQDAIRLQKLCARKKSDLDMLKLPPSRACHTCGKPSHDWECKACQAKRHEKGAWA